MALNAKKSFRQSIGKRLMDAMSPRRVPIGQLKGEPAASFRRESIRPRTPDFVGGLVDRRGLDDVSLWVHHPDAGPLNLAERFAHTLHIGHGDEDGTFKTL